MSTITMDTMVVMTDDGPRNMVFETGRGWGGHNGENTAVILNIEGAPFLIELTPSEVEDMYSKMKTCVQIREELE